MRDLVRAREAAANDLRRKRQQLLSFLLRRSRIYRGGAATGRSRVGAGSPTRNSSMPRSKSSFRKGSTRSKMRFNPCVASRNSSLSSCRSSSVSQDVPLLSGAESRGVEHVGGELSSQVMWPGCHPTPVLYTRGKPGDEDTEGGNQPADKSLINRRLSLHSQPCAAMAFLADSELAERALNRASLLDREHKRLDAHPDDEAQRPSIRRPGSPDVLRRIADAWCRRWLESTGSRRSNRFTCRRNARRKARERVLRRQGRSCRRGAGGRRPLRPLQKQRLNFLWRVLHQIELDIDRTSVPWIFWSEAQRV